MMLPYSSRLNGCLSNTQISSSSSSSSVLAASVLILLMVKTFTPVQGDLVPNPQLRIVEHPADQYVTAGQGEGQPVTLNCKASSLQSPPTITWFRSDGLPVVTTTDDPTVHRMQLPSGQLFFMHVRVDEDRFDDVTESRNQRGKDGRSDLGEYYCVATDQQSGGSVKSRRAKIGLAALQSQFIEMPRDQDGPIGGRVSFQCRPPEGQPKPRVRWIKDGRPLTSSLGGRVTTSILEDDNTSGRQVAVLTIDDVRNEDVGVYSCVVSNVAGERISRQARLIVGGL